MEEYSNLIGLGIIGAVVLVVGAIVSFLMRKKEGKKKGREKSGKAVNYKSQASLAMDDGAASFKDGKMESWKQYE